MSQTISGSTKMVLVVVVIIAILIPIALGAVLVYGAPTLPTHSSALPPSTTSTSSGSGGQSPTITIPSGAGSGANFTPASITVASGTTITFVDQDTPTHDVDFTNVPAGSTVAAGTSSPNLKDGSTYTITLTTPGTYTYVCDYHQWMKGTITVTG